MTNISKNQQIPTHTLTSGSMLTASNLDCFLNHITPSVQCQYPLQSVCADDACDGWKYHSESMPFFNLGDLWRSFDEWSAYGAGVPLVLPCGETIVQYYVPYLSALQIYLQPGCTLLSNKRRLGDDSYWSDTSDMRDTSSDFGSDNENEKLLRLQMKSDQWDSSSCVSSERLSSASSEQGDRHAELVFEYFERGPPYSRAPLAGKIGQLAAGFPQLFTLSSSDLSSASWVSVAWYPIYRIPMGPTMSDLSTCFLTFHSLWIPPVLQGDAAMECGLKHADSMLEHYGDVCLRNSDHSIEQVQEQWLRDHSTWRQKSRTTLELPAFGLACYKLSGPFWDSAGPMDKHHLSLLASSADSWLRHLQVKHPDFDFFASREGIRVYR